MVLESTMICIDNSEFMRNGDFIPSRLHAQQEAINLITQVKLRAHPENNVGLLTMAERVDVLATLSQDSGRLFMKLHHVQPKGQSNFLAGIRVAHLALKHRQGRNHRTRIVVFIGSPIDDDKGELMKLAKRLKKEKVNVDIVSFGDEAAGNTEKLETLVETLNGKDGTGSHLVTVGSGSSLQEALASSPMLVGEDGAAPQIIGGGGAYDFDPNEDPELAMALRISMEEQRQRQEDEARRVQQQSAQEAGQPVGGAQPLAQAAVGLGGGGASHFDAMTEDEQIALALQMSLQQGAEGAEAQDSMEEEQMDYDEEVGGGDDQQQQFAELMNDPKALEEMVASLPGVDPKSKEVQASLAKLKKKDGGNQPKKDEGSGPGSSSKK